MPKIDFKEEYRELFSATKMKVQIVEVPALNYLMVDGGGNPDNSLQYQAGIETLNGLSYALKAAIRKTGRHDDWTLPPVERLWWTDNGRRLSRERRELCKWTVMMMQPDFVTHELIQEARRQVEKKKSPATLSKVRFGLRTEGKCAQIMHVGSYETEGSTISKMHQFIALNMYQPDGKHHEIYLSDPKRTAPEKMRTILRQPIKPA